MTGAVPLSATPSGEAEGLGSPAHSASGQAATGNDLDLLDRARAGDRAAFGVLVERHHRALAAVLYQRLGPRAPIEDLLQDVFAKTLGHIGGFRRRSSFLTWATSIAINVGTDWQRKQIRRRRLAPTSSLEGDVVPSEEGERGLELVEERDEARRARAALDQLAEHERLAITLRVIEGRGYDEIAQRLAVPPERVRAWVSRGLKRLRKRLTEVKHG